ncbi:MAG: hypothetical protein RL376_941, partial [Verrucomicrobiota bacterium]
GETAPADLPAGPITLRLEASRRLYRFGYVAADGTDHWLGEGEVRYLCSEVTGGYNGVVFGPYATARGATGSNNQACFDWFEYQPLSP